MQPGQARARCGSSTPATKTCRWGPRSCRYRCCPAAARSRGERGTLIAWSSDSFEPRCDGNLLSHSFERFQPRPWRCISTVYVRASAALSARVSDPVSCPAQTCSRYAGRYSECARYWPDGEAQDANSIGSGLRGSELRQVSTIRLSRNQNWHS